MSSNTCTPCRRTSGWSSYPNYYSSKLASKFGKGVLSGCGGDELFGGYLGDIIKQLILVILANIPQNILDIGSA